MVAKALDSLGAGDRLWKTQFNLGKSRGKLWGNRRLFLRKMKLRTWVNLSRALSYCLAFKPFNHQCWVVEKRFIVTGRLWASS